MNTIAVYTITSGLHDEAAVSGISDSFLSAVFPEGGYDCPGQDFSSFGTHALDLVYIRTGGAEGIFKSLLPGMLRSGATKIWLLTSGLSNSLAASIEILSFLQQQGIPGEILHGREEALAARIGLLARAAGARAFLSGSRIGLVGRPSDWLIASEADRAAVGRRLSAGFVDVPMQELIDLAESFPDEAVPDDLPMKRDIRASFPGAVRIFRALEAVRDRYGLSALTVRCFDLLTSVGNTGCVALSRLNALGIPASCEGDVPALMTMMIARALTGCTGFQANPSRIDTETGEILFAHCTIPMDIPSSVQYDTHFESGIGVGIHGEFPEGPVTVFKVSGDLGRSFIAEGELLRTQYGDNLCRTQIVLRLSPTDARYFLTDPIGNHHIVIPGRHAALLREFMALL